MIGRPDHRIDVKTERARRLAALITACSAIVEAARTLRGAQHQMYLDHLVFQLQVAEAQQNLEAVAANARLQRQLEEAKAEAEVEKYKRQVRESQHPPQPPPPPPPPPAAPNVDENEVKRQTAQKVRKLESDLKLDAVEAEMDHQDKLAATALARIQKIFAEPQTLRSAKRSRILNLRDNYGIDDSLLPAGVLELLEEE